MKINPLQKLLLTVFLITVVSSCQVTRQTKTAINLANCDFRIVSAEKIELAGLPVDTYTSVKDLSIADLTMFMGVITQSTLPLSLQLNIEVKNPNPEPAGINSLEYIIFIDDIRMIEGSYMKPVTVPPSSSLIIPVPLNMDLKQALQGKSMDAILNFGFNLAGVGQVPTRFTVKLRPSILIGNTSLSYPGYITVKTEYVNRGVSR